MCIKGYYQQSEEETHKIGENICKLCIWQNRCQQIDSEVYMEMQKIQNRQHNIEREQRSWKAATTQFQDLL